jgi:hypothetical protein
MDEPKFHLGLCMAGSISAGAYTAGVLDYLFESLERWQEEKDKIRAAGNGDSTNIPMHDVVLDVLNGSSGGGMCAILSAIMLNEKGRYKSGHDSRLYKVWVDLNDSGDSPQTLEQMLGGDDLKKEGKILSLLDSTFIDHVAERTFQLDKKDVRGPGARPWLPDKIDVVVTVSNTRGIPYAIQFAGPGDNEKHCMTNFKHLMKFTTDDQLANKDGSFIKIDFSNADGQKEKDPSNIYFMQEAAKATGAFPIGLRPRTLKVPRMQVNSIHFPLSDVREVVESAAAKIPEVEMIQSNNFLCRYLQPSTVKPDWLNDESEHYTFTCVDGGMTNNEPFEIARELLLRKPPERNNIPRTPQKADRCVIMIDPFPNHNDYEKEELYKEPEDIFSMFPVLLNIMMSQPLFKLEDIELARNDDIYSRFLIIPTRSDRFGKGAIASASLGGFGGFFDRSFREHDFELGRRNGQRFLQNHFGIPVGVIGDNPVFRGKWNNEAINRFRYQKEVNGKMEYYVPIIPDMNVTGWNEQTKKAESIYVVAKQPFPTYNWKKKAPVVRKNIWKRIWLIFGYSFRHRIKKSIFKAEWWMNLLRMLAFLLILILLLPFLIIAGIPVYFIMRSYILDRIMKPIKKNFAEFDLIVRKNKKRPDQ